MHSREWPEIEIDDLMLTELRLPKETALKCVRKALLYCNRRGPNVLVGNIAVELGISIRQAELITNCFVRNKILQQASQDQLKTLGLRSDVMLFVVVGGTDPKLAFL